MARVARRQSVATKAAAGRGRPARTRIAAGVAAVAGIAAVLAAAFLWPRGAPLADLKPIAGQNVLLVTIDTLRADALGAYGGQASTPALDRLAAQGVRFDFAHAHAVLTLPSHASILTGQYPFEHGVRDNSGYRLQPGARTLASLLAQAGYDTAAFVAAYSVHSRFGLNAGFGVYDDRFGEGRGPDDFVMPERPASAVVPLAREWIAPHRGGGGNERGRAGGSAAPRGQAGGPVDRPWFVWVHVFEPHAPYQPPAPFDAQYAGRPYLGEVAAVDAALAPLIEDARNAAQPTLVIVTSDHGEGLGDHGEEAHGIFAYESTLRVPLIVAEVGGAAAPGARPALAPMAGGRGGTSPAAARHVDLLPTILDAVAQPVPAGLPGRSLLPRRERAAGAEPRPSYFEAMSGMLNHGWAPLSGVILGRDKFIDLPLAERYDLAADPGERSNAFGREPERDRALAAALRGFGPALPGRRAEESAEAAARLRALGYVSGAAPAKATYTEDDDPKRLIDLDGAIHRALEAAGSGRPEEAAQLYRQVIERRPDMAIAYRHLAFIDYERGDVAGGVEVLRQGVARGVADARALAQLGEYLVEAGRIGEGIRVLEPLTQDAAAGADALNALGIAYARAGRPADARGAFERLSAALPGSSAPLENLGVLALEQGDVAGARLYFERAAAMAPASSRALAGLGAAAIRTGDRRVAYDAWARAIQLDPANCDALFSLGVNLARDGRMDLARPYLEGFVKAAPPARYAGELRSVSRLLASSPR